MPSSIRPMLLIFALGILLTAPAGAQGAFPGKNGKIAFWSERDGNSEIYTMNADGSAQTNITQSPSTVDVSPAWSPDGKLIAFTRGYEAEPGNLPQGIYIMNADGTGQRFLTSGACPAWSPDGQSISFLGFIGNSPTLSVIRTDGSGKTALVQSTFTQVLCSSVWSPDGSRVAFTKSVTGNEEVFAVNADGSNEIRLTDSPHADAIGDWSPDGSRILFLTSREPQTSSQEIYVMNPDGTDQHKLISLPTGTIAGGTSWSPDGQRLTFSLGPIVGNPTNDDDIYVSGIDGAGLTRLTPDDGFQDLAPDWQPLVKPKRGDFKNAAAYCRALRVFLGTPRFRQRYKNHGRCVRENRWFFHGGVRD